MKSILLNLSGVILFATLTIACENDITIPENENKSEVQRIGPQELVFASKIISGNTPIIYQSLSYDLNDNNYYDLERDSFESYFISRPIEALEITVSGLLSDGNHNQIFRSEFVSKEGVLSDYSITITAVSDVIIAVDVGQNNLVDLVVQQIDDDLISILANAETKEVLRCVEGLDVASLNLFEDILDCLSKFGSGGGGGWNQLNEMLDNFLDPECKDTPIVAVKPSPIARRADRIRRLGETVEILGGGAAQHRRLVVLCQETAQLLKELDDVQSLINEGTLDPGALNDLEQQAKNISSDIARNYEEIVQRYRDFTDDIGLDPLNDPNNPGGNMISHPKCQQRDIDAARGTLFSNKEFCLDADFINCLRKQNSVLYALTEGQCYIEEGPEGGRQLICIEADRDESMPVLPPDDGYFDPENDDLDPNAPTGNSGQIADAYINLTPLGDFLIGLCARGGCPYEL